MKQPNFSTKFSTGADTDVIGSIIEDMTFQAIMRRRVHERRWYDNLYFDDGYHFRFISKKTGIVIDHVDRTTGFIERAIPRASKQIRGIGSLLFTPEYYPVIYPQRVIEEDFLLKSTSQVDQQAFQLAKEKSKIEARLRGTWLTTEWEDEQNLPLKLLDMILTASKESIGWLKVYTDPRTHKICTSVRDAFDIICFGDKKWHQELPFLTDTTAMDIEDVMSDDMFDEDKRAKINPDNKYATSEIKDAYMRARYGVKISQENDRSVIVKETFIKEYLSDENWDRAKELGEDNGAMEHKSRGDMIMRHVFSCAGITLRDEYVNYDKYPYAEFRFEPGYLYQVPLIERFIPLNKALDVTMTRMEKFVNTMVTGIYQQRKNENFSISNFPGGQVLQYETAPLEQMGITNPGQTPFAVIEEINKLIDEQGLSATNPQQLPNGIANNTIENLQQQEYANMKPATLMLKHTITEIAELMMERAHKDYIKPQEVEYKEEGQVKYFDIIGKDGYKKHKAISKSLPRDIVTIDKDAKVRVEIEQGFGLTMDGKRKAMKEIIENLIELYKLGFLGPDALSMVIKRFLETYGYGSTEEFMENVEKGVTQGQMTQTQLQQMKLALLQVLKDAKAVGPEADQKLVDSTKLGVLHTLHETGLLDQLNQEGKTNIEVDDLVKLYKDAPDDVRRQIETLLGMQPSTSEPISPSQSDSAHKLHEIIRGKHEMANPPQAAPGGK